MQLIYTVAVMKELGLIAQIQGYSVLKAGLIQLTFSLDGIHFNWNTVAIFRYIKQVLLNHFNYSFQ